MTWVIVKLKSSIYYGFMLLESVHIKEDIVLLTIHVDNCILTGSNVTLLTQFKQKIGKVYQITNLGPISWLLGIKVVHGHPARTLKLSQTAYIDSIIQRFNFDNLKPVSIPINPTMQYTKSQSPQIVTEIACIKCVPYREAIGLLMYVVIGTHPDIAFAISTLAKFARNPGQVHWDAAKCVFQYQREQ